MSDGMDGMGWVILYCCDTKSIAKKTHLKLVAERWREDRKSKVSTSGQERRDILTLVLIVRGGKRCIFQHLLTMTSEIESPPTTYHAFSVSYKDWTETCPGLEFQRISETQTQKHTGRRFFELLLSCSRSTDPDLTLNLKSAAKKWGGENQYVSTWASVLLKIVSFCFRKRKKKPDPVTKTTSSQVVLTNRFQDMSTVAKMGNQGKIPKIGIQ